MRSRKDGADRVKSGKQDFFIEFYLFRELEEGRAIATRPRREGLKGGRIHRSRMGQTGSRVASKIANSFTFHGSPRYRMFTAKKSVKCVSDSII